MTKRHLLLIKTCLLTTIPALFIGANAAPPVNYEQWKSCSVVQNPSGSAGTCPAGFTCGSAIFSDGIMQRSITDSQGDAYFQTIVTGAGGSGAAPAPAGGNAAAAALSVPGSAHGPYAYLLDVGANAVTTIDLSVLSALPVAEITAVGSAPATVALAANGAFLYVANQGDHSVSVVRAFDRQIVDTLALTAEPITLLVNGSLLYVTHPGGQDITVIDLVRREIAGSLKLEEGADRLLLHPDGRHFYGLAPAAGELRVFDAASGAVTGRLSLAMSGSGGDMVFAPDGGRLYIALSDGSTTTLRSLDVASNLLHDAPQSFFGALDRLLLSQAADELLLDTVNAAAGACSTAKNGFYAINPATLVPTLIRDLNAGAAVIATEEGGTRLVLDRALQSLQRWSADTRQVHASVTLPAALLANGSVINPALRAALRPTVSALDFGKTNVGSANTKTLSLVNDGALPVGITALRFLPLALNLSAALDADNFSVSTDRCSGLTLLPAESCELGVTHQPGSASSAQTVLQVIANPASASSSVSVIGTGVASGPDTARPAAPDTAEATIAGGGVFAPHLLLIALALRRRRQHG